MCGGDLEVTGSVGTCQYCGTKQTLPNLDDDRRAVLYDRASHFRRQNDFDKAAEIYQTILNEDKTDAEAYWSLVLCKYGVEYVEDPKTKRRIPTCHRTQFTSVLSDEDYKQALKYADESQRVIYEAEASAINAIQKGILEVSNKEEPYDVFICYKETDESGNRTKDSLRAQEIYYQLEKEGYKIFFSRITLEDKLGHQYEPYIFAALSSAKVMLVVGTKPEHFNAVWVRNEWSRFLALMKDNKDKLLIPCYSDMDPYDLPGELSLMQSQDMSKIGFIQDLIRGIKKIVSADTPKVAVKETVIVSGTNTEVEPLLERAFMFLEDGDFSKADDFCEQVLNLQPKNAKAYLGKLMSELRCRKVKDLKNSPQPFDNLNSYVKVLRFADKELAENLKGYVAHIKERNETARIESIYVSAKNAMATASREANYEAAAKKFKSISGYKDSDELAKTCLDKAEQSRKDFIYLDAKVQAKGDQIQGYAQAIVLLKRILDWKDSEQLIVSYEAKIKELEEKKEQEKLLIESRVRKENERQRKLKRIVTILGSTLTVFVLFLVVFNASIIPASKYRKAERFLSKGDTIRAGIIYSSLGNYKDSKKKAQENEIIMGGMSWRCLKVEKNRALIITENIVEKRYYHSNRENIGWEKCDLRAYLNTTFYNEFSEEEKLIILEVNNKNTAKHGTSGGNQTKDKIFCLSPSEAKKYFKNDRDRVANVRLAKVDGTIVHEGPSIWWLRSPSGSYVAYTGNIGSKGGFDVSKSDVGVRPALWIDLSS